jgi:15-cis-phytoene desaturase
MSEACAEYAEQCSNGNEGGSSMLELVLAPAAPYMKCTDEEILHATLVELERLFPQEIAVDQSKSPAKVRKFTCVRTPTSVYETLPGMEDARPTQVSPIENFFCAGDFSKQKYLASMEGAILSGQLAARAVSEKAALMAKSSTPWPRALTERPIDPQAPDAKESTTPDRTMYVAQRALEIPHDVQNELNGLPSPATV